MAVTDPIAEMLTRIRNAIMAGKSEISLPHSQSKEKIAQIMVTSGFLSATSTKKTDFGIVLNITINHTGESPKITEIHRLSKPGRRLYAGTDRIPTIKQGRGLVVISTSEGMMTGQQAKSKGLGGELICKVY